MVTVCPSQFATRRTLFHVLVGCGLLMLKVSRLKLPVIWLLVSMWLNTLTKSQIWTLLLKVQELHQRDNERRATRGHVPLGCRESVWGADWRSERTRLAAAATTAVQRTTRRSSPRARDHRHPGRSRHAS